MFKKFFGNFGKKNDGFYAVAEDDKAELKSEPKAKAPAKTEPADVPAPTVAVAAAVTPAAPAAKVDVKAAAKAERDAAKAAAKAEKKSGKKAEAPKVVAAPAPAPVAVAAEPQITNFATDYLIKPSSISGRRQPGANMKGFLDLARQVEKPKGFKAAASERK
jgi:hypothetical protein